MSTYFNETLISPFCTCGFSNPVTSSPEVKLFTATVHGWKLLTIAAKNSILNLSGLLGQLLFINITISNFFRKTIIGCFRNFKVIFTVYHHHVCSTTNSLDSTTARKSATKERRRRNKKSYLFLYQSGWAIWMLLCYKVTRKSFFPRDLFVLTLDECFVTPERLFFSVASSQN